MMKDLYIKNKRILLFYFDGTLVETISGGLYAKDLTDMKIKQDVVNRALDLDDVKKVTSKVRDLDVVYVLDRLSEPILKRFSKSGLMKERA